MEAHVGYLNPTPDAINGSIIGSAIVAEPTFDHSAGFYSSSFPLVISTTTTGAQIYYTLDGTVPTLTNGTLYTGPITISGESNVRATAFAPGDLSSDVNTVSYIYVAQVLQQGSTAPPGFPTTDAGSTAYYGMSPTVVDNPLYSSELAQDLLNIPTFSLTVNLNDLFNPSTGIYSNPTGDGIVDASIEYIPGGSAPGFQANVGIAIHGGADVLSTNDPKRGFRIEFGNQYGELRSSTIRSSAPMRPRRSRSSIFAPIRTTPGNTQDKIPTTIPPSRMHSRARPWPRSASPRNIQL